jgi:hypothetical protein
LNHDKSIQEQIILDNFRKHYPEFPKGKLIKSESPDFIIKTGLKNSIGIELTSLPSSNYHLSLENTDDFLSDLVHSISKKEQKLKIYLEKEAESYWLIIFADSIELNGFSLNGLFESSFSNNGFDRVFLFGLFEGRVWELDR